MCYFRSRLWSPLLAGIALVTGGLSAAIAQEAPAPPSRCYVKKAIFVLPFNMNDGLRSQIREVQLYWQNPASGKWILLQQCPPTQPGFKFEAEKDGEYVFTIGMVDLGGTAIPADPEQSPQRMSVVVDTQPPSADVQLVQTGNEGQTIQVDVRDTYLDANKTQVHYQTKDQVWRWLEPLAGQSGRYCIPGQAATTGLIRIAATDLAGNIMRREFDVSQGAVGGPVPEASNTIVKTIPDAGPVELVQAKSVQQPSQPAASLVNVGQTIPAPDRGIGTRPVQTVPMDNVARLPISDPAGKTNDVELRPEPNWPTVAPQGVPLRPEQRPSGPYQPVAANVKPATPIINSSVSVVKSAHPPQEKVVAVPENLPVPEPTLAPQMPVTPVSVDRQLINHPQVLLAYKVDQVGTSGIGKVEVWLTRDMGKSWQKFCEDPHRKSPLAVELPGEGLYGITLVVSNGRGFGAAPPKPGDSPDAWVEVDLSRPSAELTGVRAGTGQDSGALFISWTAKDRNLATDSVELFYSSTRDGNWQSVARGLGSEGTYRWVPPNTFGPHAFVRLVVRDLAGNSTVVETPQPIAVDDLSRPRGRLLSVSPSPLRPEIHLEPTGN